MYLSTGTVARRSCERGTAVFPQAFAFNTENQLAIEMRGAYSHLGEDKNILQACIRNAGSPRNPCSLKYNARPGHANAKPVTHLQQQSENGEKAQACAQGGRLKPNKKTWEGRPPTADLNATMPPYTMSL